jgi:hypothetical protein
MKNLDQSEAIFYQNELVTFLHFDTVFYCENLENKIEERIMISVGGSVLNVATDELYN